MSLLAALTLAAAQPAPAPPPPMVVEIANDDRQVLDRFRAACEQVPDYSASVQRASAAGWSPGAESVHPQLARLNQVARQLWRERPGGTYQDRSFSAALGPRTLFLVLSRWEGAEGWVNACRVYDLGAARPVGTLVLGNWMGRPATRNHVVGTAGANRVWEPGWREGTTVSVNHVPATSPFVARYGISGNVFVAQALGAR